MQRKKVKAPIEYFNTYNFSENLLLSFFYDSSKSLQIVIHHFDVNGLLSRIINKVKVPSDKKLIEFREFYFINVENYNREMGQNQMLKNTYHHYDASKDFGQHVIQDVKINKSENVFVIEFWFDYSLGGFKFSFEEFFERRRISYPIYNEAGKCEYFDMETNNKFNLYTPFEDL